MAIFTQERYSQGLIEMRWYWYAAIGLAGYAIIAGPDNNSPRSNPSPVSAPPVTTQDSQTQKVRKPTPTKNAAPTEASSMIVTGSAVNIRSGPGVSFKIIDKRYKGERVAVVAEQGQWSKIEHSSGSAWISSNYIRGPNTVAATSPKAAPPKRSVAVPSSSEIAAAKKEIIRISIRQYPGSCPCPYNRDRGGRRCGKRSAWSKPGGYSPMCYESDVSDARVKTYFARKR